MSLILALILVSAAVPQTTAQPGMSVEAYQVTELPITITDGTLLRAKDGYLLKCLMANNSEFSLLGLRYSLAVVDPMNVTKVVVTRSEGLKLAQHETKSLIFRTPIKLKLKPDDRLVLLPEQIVSSDYVWEVMKPKNAMQAYIAGDYSVQPRVQRLRNQVDAPPRRRVIY